jgi:ribosome silencing factor RsfS/YbeB/iojap
MARTPKPPSRRGTTSRGSSSKGGDDAPRRAPSKPPSRSAAERTAPKRAGAPAASKRNPAAAKGAPRGTGAAPSRASGGASASARTGAARSSGKAAAPRGPAAAAPRGRPGEGKPAAPRAAGRGEERSRAPRPTAGKSQARPTPSRGKAPAGRASPKASGRAQRPRGAEDTRPGKPRNEQAKPRELQAKPRELQAKPRELQAKPRELQAKPRAAAKPKPTVKEASAAGPKARAPRARKQPALTPDRLDRLVAAAVKSLEDDKAENVVVLDVTGRASFADRMVIATGLADRQIQAMAAHLDEALGKEGLKLRKDAIQASDEWVLIDAGDLVVHLFKPDARETYALEKMWGPDSPLGDAAPGEVSPI